MSPGDLLASLLGGQLCWAPICGSSAALLPSTHRRSAGWDSLAGKAQLRQKEKTWALLTSINGRSASWASLGGKAQLRQKKADLHDGGVSKLGSLRREASACTAPRDLQDRVQEHTSSRSFDRVQEGGQRLHVTLLTILRSCTGAPPRTVWPSRIKER